MIALIGNLSRDLLPGQAPRAGGGPFHGARALARQSARARIFARCAAGDREALFTPLAQIGVAAEYVPGDATATFAFSYAGDRREMEVAALGDVWEPEDLPALDGVRWVHVAPLLRSDFPPRTLAAIARHRNVALDGQGLVRVSKIGPLELDADYDPDILRHVTVLKLADDEAAVLGDPAELPVPEVIVTHGSRGATLYTGGKTEHVVADAVDADPTGAGDAFCISYVVARAAGLDPLAATRQACAVVSSLLRTP